MVPLDLMTSEPDTSGLSVPVHGVLAARKLGSTADARQWLGQYGTVRASDHSVTHGDLDPGDAANVAEFAAYLRHLCVNAGNLSPHDLEKWGHRMRPGGINARRRDEFWCRNLSI
jgi:hypothetical protein